VKLPVVVLTAILALFAGDVFACPYDEDTPPPATPLEAFWSARPTEQPFSALSLVLSAEDNGRDERVGPSPFPTVEVAFARESYAPGEAARLVFFSTARRVSLRIFRAGTEAYRLRSNDMMDGTPVTPVHELGPVGAGRTITTVVGAWPSGLYYAEVIAEGSRVGYAPFVLRPRRLGDHRVAVVMPTQTWEAYNFRDDDDDGRPDTWYGNPDTREVRLARPFESRGVPPHYRVYDQPFLRWLHATGRSVDFLSDRELNRTSAATLSRAYDLIVFSGHHEYVTEHEYDAVLGFRDRGGNLMFLSANNFFWRVDLHADVMTRISKWRDLGRPEAQLVGVQYVDWNHDRYHSRPYVVRAARSARWIFRRTGLDDGDRFGTGGIEIDARAPSSPPGTHMLAVIPEIFGPGTTAEMTYYETRGGARVFASGAFSVAASIRQPAVRAVVENLWHRLSRP
jgi:hypothetical protein